MATTPPDTDYRITTLERRTDVQDVEIAALRDSLHANTSALEAVVRELRDLKTKGLLVLLVVAGGANVAKVIAPLLGLG